MVRRPSLAPVSGWFGGAPCASLSGNSPVLALGSITVPERMCAPGWEPFSGHDGQVTAQLLVADRSSQNRRPCAKNDHIMVHFLTIAAEPVQRRARSITPPTSAKKARPRTINPSTPIACERGDAKAFSSPTTRIGLTNMPKNRQD